MAQQQSTPPVSSGDDDFTKAVEASVKAYLDANLPDLVKAAMPPTPEQQAQAEQESLAERMRKHQQQAERRARREAREAQKAAEAAAAEQAKQDAAAAKAFEDAMPFVGNVADLTAKIVQSIRIDDGTAYSAEHVIGVRFADLEATTDGGLILTKPITLAGRGREFSVQGVSLITDAGVMRIVLNGSRKCGGGKAVQFPARSLVFRPLHPSALAEAQA